MDIYGRNPDSPAGKYFRANIWSWHPIHALCIDLCSDLIDEDTLIAMSCNNGAGPHNQETCTQMAIGFDNWLEHNADGHGLESEMQITNDGRFVSEGEALVDPELETRSPFSVDDDHIKEWVEFLRHCGGFQVY